MYTVHKPLHYGDTLTLSNPLCVLLPPHTIPCVSLVCSCRESFSQLSLHGLKLPGQVYSAVSPCAAGPGSVESPWILSVSSTSSSVTPLTPLHNLTALHELKYSWLQLTHKYQKHLSLISFTDFNFASHLCCISVICLHIFIMNYTHRQKKMGCNVMNMILEM